MNPKSKKFIGERERELKRTELKKRRNLNSNSFFLNADDEDYLLIGNRINIMSITQYCFRFQIQELDEE